MSNKIPRHLNIRGQVTKTGINLLVNKEKFPIIYPKEIWRAYPKNLKEILKDNLAYSTTIFLPSMFNLKEIHYQTARPIAESFLFKNGIYDMPICAAVDQKPALEYVKRFFNTQFLFKDNQIQRPEVIRMKEVKGRRKAVIPVSFGKESLLSFALGKEIGVEPILVSVIEPANKYEYFHKKKLIQQFEKEFKIKVYTIKYQPGLLRYGHHWRLKTELGWGLQTTEYALMMLPFVHYFNAAYVVLGNEQSCNNVFFNREGVLTYKAGFDQHHHWTAQQGLLASLILGRRLEVVSFMDPLYEIAITKILHHRYPAVGKYQMSCMADNHQAKNNRWCQHCVKCGYLYATLAAFNINPQTVGFTENLFDKKHSKIYDHFFNYNPQAPAYGSPEELGLAFYLAYLNGCQGLSLVKFKKTLMTKITRQKKYLFGKYLGLTPSDVLPAEFKKQLLALYRQALKPFS